MSDRKHDNLWRDEGDWLGFFGVGLNTPTADTRAYWLVEGESAGRRLPPAAPAAGSEVTSFSATVEHKPRVLYFGALVNGDAENFFGPVIDAAGVEEPIRVHHPVSWSRADVALEVVVQGVTAEAHRINIEWNGLEVGQLSFTGRERATATVNFPHAYLGEGENRVRLSALGGEYDVSLIDVIRVRYDHRAAADDDEQQVTLAGGRSIAIEGFTQAAVRVLDVTDPGNVREVIPEVTRVLGSYTVSFGNAGTQEGRFYVFGERRSLSPGGIAAVPGSSWNRETEGYDVLLVTHPDFKDAALQLQLQHEQRGRRVALVTVEELYNEFSFGNKDGGALKQFVTRALTTWQRKPRWLVLLGDASADPRNYLGMNVADYVPTHMIPTTYLEAPCDDWFADLDDDGVPELGV